MSSLFLVQEENILYNFGYFSDKTAKFKTSICPIKKRFNHIVKCYNSILHLLSEVELRKYTFRFDELYDFTFKDTSTIDVKIEIQNAHNFSLDCNKKYTVRVLTNDKLQTSLCLLEAKSLRGISFENKGKKFDIHAMTIK